MGIVIDIVLVVIFAFTLYQGVRRGFVKSVIETASFFIALIIAATFCGSFSNFVNKKYINKAVTERVKNSLEDIIDNEVEGLDIGSVLSNDPEELEKKLSGFGVTIDEVRGYYQEDTTGNAETALDRVSGKIASPIADAISNIVAFAVLFVATLIILTIIKIILDAVVSLPVLKTANSVLGGIFGALSGFFTISVIALVLARLLDMLEKLGKGSNIVETTHVLKFLCEYNLFGKIIIKCLDLI